MADGGMVAPFIGWPDVQDTACRFCEKPVEARDQRSDLVSDEGGWRTPKNLKEAKHTHPAHLTCWIDHIKERERVRRMAGR